MPIITWAGKASYLHFVPLPLNRERDSVGGRFPHRVVTHG
jgi:hypothetical protein